MASKCNFPRLPFPPIPFPSIGLSIPLPHFSLSFTLSFFCPLD